MGWGGRNFTGPTSPPRAIAVLHVRSHHSQEWCCQPGNQEVAVIRRTGAVKHFVFAVDHQLLATGADREPTEQPSRLTFLEVVRVLRKQLVENRSGGLTGEILQLGALAGCGHVVHGSRDGVHYRSLRHVDVGVAAVGRDQPLAVSALKHQLASHHNVAARVEVCVRVI